jgi:hypothetical protein
MHNKKTLNTVIMGAGIAAVVGGLAYWSSLQPPQLERSYPPRAPGEVRPAPVYRIPSGDVRVDMIPPQAPVERSQGVLVMVQEKHLQSLAQYAPVWYEITGLKNFKVSLPVDHGQSLAAVQFTAPISLENKVLTIYGMDPATKQRVALFEKKFVPARAYH